MTFTVTLAEMKNKQGQIMIGKLVWDTIGEPGTNLIQADFCII